MGLEIGNNVMIGRGSKLFTLGHDVSDPHFKPAGGKIVIEDNVIVFPYCAIMPNIRIGENAVIYPFSVITKDIEANSITGGNPAKHIKERDCDPKYAFNYKTFFGV